MADEDIGRAARVKKLYEDDVRSAGTMPDRAARTRQKQLAEAIARESPDEPARTPLEILSNRGRK